MFNNISLSLPKIKIGAPTSNHKPLTFGYADTFSSGNTNSDNTKFGTQSGNTSSTGKNGSYDDSDSDK